MENLCQALRRQKDYCSFNKLSHRERQDSRKLCNNVVPLTDGSGHMNDLSKIRSLTRSTLQLQNKLSLYGIYPCDLAAGVIVRGTVSLPRDPGILLNFH